VTFCLLVGGYCSFPVAHVYDVMVNRVDLWQSMALHLVLGLNSCLILCLKKRLNFDYLTVGTKLGPLEGLLKSSL